MEAEDNTLIAEQFKKLPEPLQKAIDLVPWKSFIKEIAATNKLPLDKITLVERETMFVLYGFENPKDYITNMIREVEIPEETAITIAETVNEKIFKEISLKADSLEKEEKVTPQQMAVVAQSVPEIIHKNLPMIESEEKVHNVPHVENTTTPLKTTPPAPQHRYAGGIDPYREPLV